MLNDAQRDSKRFIYAKFLLKILSMIQIVRLKAAQRSSTNLNDAQQSRSARNGQSI